MYLDPGFLRREKEVCKMSIAKRLIAIIGATNSRFGCIDLVVQTRFRNQYSPYSFALIWCTKVDCESLSNPVTDLTYLRNLNEGLTKIGFQILDLV